MSTATQSPIPKYSLSSSRTSRWKTTSSRPAFRRFATELGPQLLILGHHYQQDEVIALSDLRGDSYQLSQLAAESTDCRQSRSAASTSWPRRPTSWPTGRRSWPSAAASG